MRSASMSPERVVEVAGLGVFVVGRARYRARLPGELRHLRSVAVVEDPRLVLDPHLERAAIVGISTSRSSL